MRDICSICIHEALGCGRTDEPIDLRYKYDKDGNLIKCSGFFPDCEILKRIHILLEKEKGVGEFVTFSRSMGKTNAVLGGEK